jgi:uracil-DNA glycosylase
LAGMTGQRLVCLGSGVLADQSRRRMTSDRYGESQLMDAAIERLRRNAAGCPACHLWVNATQTVFGQGPVPAWMMLVGEQPGDQEDRTGRPFVGPAGQVLDEALKAAAVDRDSVYVTNAVKHFKWKPRGKRRIHDKPNHQEVGACAPWLVQEIRAVKPQVLVLLGATAAQAILGPGFRVTKSRGQDLTDVGWAPHVLATAHPSAVLRVPDREDRVRAEQELAEDLRAAARFMRS